MVHQNSPCRARRVQRHDDGEPDRRPLHRRGRGPGAATEPGARSPGVARDRPEVSCVEPLPGRSRVLGRPHRRDRGRLDAGRDRGAGRRREQARERTDARRGDRGTRFHRPHARGHPRRGADRGVRVLSRSHDRPHRRPGQHARLGPHHRAAAALRRHARQRCAATGDGAAERHGRRPRGPDPAGTDGRPAPSALQHRGHPPRRRSHRHRARAGRPDGQRHALPPEDDAGRDRGRVPHRHVRPGRGPAGQLLPERQSDKDVRRVPGKPRAVLAGRAARPPSAVPRTRRRVRAGVARLPRRRHPHREFGGGRPVVAHCRATRILVR